MLLNELLDESLLCDVLLDELLDESLLCDVPLDELLDESLPRKSQSVVLFVVRMSAPINSNINRVYGWCRERGTS